MARILAVEDSETVRTQLRKDLEDAGHEVIEAEDGAAGLAQFQANAGIELVISDLNMPNMDGITMCAKLHEAGHRVPIFMLTTEAVEHLKQKAKENGVVAWIVKPYSADKLTQAVAKILARAKGS